MPLVNDPISQLTELAAIAAEADEFVLVDKSDTTDSVNGTTKRQKRQYVIALKKRTLDSGPGTQTVEDDLIFLDPTGGTFTLNLMAAASWVHPLRVKNIANPASSSNVVTLDGDGSENIDFDPTYDLAPGETLLLDANAGKIEIIGR